MNTRDLPIPPMINTMSPMGIGDRYRGAASDGFANATWPTANLAIYIPFWLPEAITVRKLGWINGATQGSTNDIGVFNAAGKKLVSGGGTAGSGANVPQTIDVTDTYVPGGRIWVGMSCSNNTATFYRASEATPSGLYRTLGLLQEASAEPLPANMTGVVLAQAYIPLIYIVTDTVVTP